MNFSFLVVNWYQIPYLLTHTKILTENNYKLIKDLCCLTLLQAFWVKSSIIHTAIMLNIHVCEKTISKSDIIGWLYECFYFETKYRMRRLSRCLTWRLAAKQETKQWTRIWTILRVIPRVSLIQRPPGDFWWTHSCKSASIWSISSQTKFRRGMSC